MVRSHLRRLAVPVTAGLFALACGEGTSTAPSSGEDATARLHAAPAAEAAGAPQAAPAVDSAAQSEPAPAAEPEAAPQAAAQPAPGAEVPIRPPLEMARAEVEMLRRAVSEAEGRLDRARQQLAAAEERVAALEAERKAAVPDDVLFRRVQRRLLEDPALSEVAIAAEVSGGVVTLRGSVPDPDTADAAVKIAEAVEGVGRVDSRIEVRD